MKRIGLLFFVAVSLLFSFSCKKQKEDINKATEFTMNYSNEVSMPGTTLVATQSMDVTTPEFPTNSKNKFADENTAEALIEDVFLSKLTISNKSGGNLDFLNSIDMYIKATGLSDVKVAFKTQIPKGATAVDLDVTKNDIKQFIFKDNIQFRIVANVTTGNPDEQKLKMDEAITVRGKRL